LRLVARRSRTNYGGASLYAKQMVSEVVDRTSPIRGVGRLPIPI
jgi:hypothetical protein